MNKTLKERFWSISKGPIFSLLVMAILILLLEFIFRILDIKGYYLPRTREWHHALVNKAELVPGVRIQFKPFSSFQFAYESNPRNYFDKNNALTYVINNVGFRDHDYSIVKPEGVTRVLILGDSFAFGEGVRLEHAFPNLLEHLLQGADYSVEVLNFSVGGWGTRDQISYFKHIGISFSPDIVLVAYVLNDADWAGGLDVWDEFRRQYAKSAFRHSYFLSFAYARFAQRLLVTKYVDNMVSRSLNAEDNWETSFNKLDLGKQLATEHGATFGVAILPFMYDLSDSYPFLPIHEMIVDHCVRSEIDVCDLYTYFKGHNHQKLWVHPSDPHPNELGHEIIAKAIFDFIISQNFLVVKPSNTFIMK